MDQRHFTNKVITFRSNHTPRPYFRTLLRLPGLTLVTLTLALTSLLTIEGLETEMASAEETQTAVFAGGCFWCMETVFDKVNGVISTTSGYTGGELVNPTYEQVSSGSTGHTEAIELKFDPEKVSYEELLEIFWRNIDPTVKDRQFCDVGTQYRSAIFYIDESQKKSAQISKDKLLASGRFKEGIMTEIIPAKKFYPAEEYHQNYYIKNPVRYRTYRYACGRDQRLNELWEDEKKAKE